MITARLQALHFARMGPDGVFRTAFSSQSCPVVMTTQKSICVTGEEVGMGEVKVSDDGWHWCLSYHASGDGI